MDEGTKLTEELVRNQEKEVSERGREEIEAILLEMNIAQRKDIESLEARINELEKELNQTEE